MWRYIVAVDFVCTVVADEDTLLAAPEFSYRAALLQPRNACSLRRALASNELR